MDALDRLKKADAVARLAARDTSLYSDDPDVRERVQSRLGWTTLAADAERLTATVTGVAAHVRQAGATDVVLLGMGGSSLAPLVLSRVFGAADGHPALHVLDTTSPTSVNETLTGLNPRTTWVVVSSKSGTTIEPLSLFSVFRRWLENSLGTAAPEHFIAITDPGTPLASLASTNGFHALIEAPADVGGRFSALSAFGLLPAALLGIDMERFTSAALRMEEACSAPSDDNPAAVLAGWLTDAHSAGRDKLTLLCSETLSSFALWIEQLIAESTGKRGAGIVPIPELSPLDPPFYGPDRAPVIIRLADDAKLDSVAADLAPAAFEIVIDDIGELGAEFVRWTWATGLVGHLLGIDPYDEPDVSAAKAATSRVLGGQVTPPSPTFAASGIGVTALPPLASPADPHTLADALRPAVSSLGPRDYLTVLAYVPETHGWLSPLASAVSAVSDATGAAACLELGPRYLHSTGQLHKGGPDTGVFIMLVAATPADVDVPGEPYTLGRLFRSQADGDMLTLSDRGRRVVRLDLTDEPASAELVASALKEAAGS